MNEEDLSLNTAENISNEDWFEIVHAIPDFVMQVDRNYNIIFVNHFQPGLRKEDYIGKSIWNGVPKEDHFKVKEKYERIFEIGKDDEWEMKADSGPGKIGWYRVRASRMIRGNGELSLVIISSDITKQKQAEESLREKEVQLRLALQASGDGLWDWNILTNKVYYSPEWEAMFGFELGSVPQTLDSMKPRVHLEDIEGMFKEVESYLSGEIPSYGKEFRMIHKDGRLMYTWHRGVAVFDKSGKPIRMLGTTTDITEQKKNEEALVKAKNLAESATRAKSEFLATMSHEIRTPLNAVIGFSDLLLRTELNDTQIKYMEILSKSANSLLFLLNDILDFSKIEAGKLELNIEKVDIIELLKQSSEIIKFQADEKKVKLSIRFLSEIPRMIMADSIRLRQILINLLGNALKFTKEGEIEIIAEATQIRPETHDLKLLISVRDTGIGISIENKKKIFEAFSQEDSSVSRKYGGTGLGLSISNKLLGLMNSNLELESELGKGSRFYFTLNVKYVEGDIFTFKEMHSIEKTQVRNKAIIESYISLSKVKILIVDDDDINRYLADTILSRILPNAEKIHAADGKEAIEFFKKEKLDIILLDIQMPELNGFETAESIRKLEVESRIPIIALTAGIVKEDIEACLISGMDDYLSKPIVINDFESILRKWLDISEIGKAGVEENHHFNFLEFKNRFEMNRELLIKVLSIANKTLPTTAKDFKENLEIKNLKFIHSLAHKVKGMALTICSPRLANIALEIENQLEFGSISLLIQRIEVEIDLVNNIISKRLDELLSNTNISV